MTDFTKTKISFALALLGTMFALHPFIEKVEKYGLEFPKVEAFGYEIPELKVDVAYAFTAVAILLAVCVYSYALALVSEKPTGWLERLGNWTYALALMVFPLYGGLYLTSLAGDYAGQKHLKWGLQLLPVAAGGLWLLLTLGVAWRFRYGLAAGDQRAKLRHLAEHEINSVKRAQDMLNHQHYDLAVVEAWRAVEARLRALLISRNIHPAHDNHEGMLDAAARAGLAREQAVKLIRDLHNTWTVAISVDPVSPEAANASLAAARTLLATLPVAGHQQSHRAHA